MNMRKEFAKHIEQIAIADSKVIFLTGDLGFMSLEKVRESIGDRFINVGVSEQNMISMAASLAYENLIPICYSIAPFAVFRPAEQIRLDIGLHNMNVKIVGNGGGYGYGIMGATHHALEDIAVISSFQNFRCFIPYSNEDVSEVMKVMMQYKGPSYLRLGFGIAPTGIINPSYSAIRKLFSGSQLTIIGLGPIVLNAFEAIDIDSENSQADIFVVSEMPLLELSQEFLVSIRNTKKLLIIEEHVSRGGLGENLAILLIKNQVTCEMIHRCAIGYPNGLYGNQQYHHEICGLDSNSLLIDIENLIQY